MGKEDRNRPYSAEEDPNYIAYKEALGRGDFSELDPESWLAFADGKLVGSAFTREELMDSLDKKVLRKGPMLTQVNPEPIKLHGFFTDPEGNLRRGVPITAYNEQGEEVPGYLEFNTQTFFPASNPGNK
jgi:hypothetical protein